MNRAARGREASGARGQATVELVLLLPLLFAAGLAVFAFLASGRAQEHAAAAAHAAAVALLQDGDARSAARAAVPRDRRHALRLAVRTGRVRVWIPADVPVFGRLLTAEAAAVAR